MAKQPASARHEQRQQTRAKLLDAALRVFAEQGYDHATVEEISLAAGHSKGAYYFHFDSKEDVLLELLTTWIDDQTERLREFEKAHVPAAIALLETIEALLRYDDRDPCWRLLLPEIWVQSHRNAKVRETLQSAYQRWIDLLKDAFEKAEREGMVSLVVRPDIAASLVLAAHDGLTLRSQVKSQAEAALPPSRVLAALVALVAPSERPTAPVAPQVLRRTVRRKK